MEDKCPKCNSSWVRKFVPTIGCWIQSTLFWSELEAFDSRIPVKECPNCKTRLTLDGDKWVLFDEKAHSHLLMKG